MRFPGALGTVAVPVHEEPQAELEAGLERGDRHRLPGPVPLPSEHRGSWLLHGGCRRQPHSVSRPHPAAHTATPASQDGLLSSHAGFRALFRCMGEAKVSAQPQEEVGGGEQPTLLLHSSSVLSHFSSLVSKLQMVNSQTPCRGSE